MKSGDLRVEVVDDDRALAALEEPWWALLAGSPGDRCFASPAWLRAGLAIGEGLSPRVVTAYRDGALAGVLPLCLDRQRGELGFVTDLSDYNDLVAAPGDRGARAILLDQALRMAGPEGRLRLAGLHPEALLLAAIRERDPGAAAEGSRAAEACPFVALDAGFDAWFASRSASFREALRRRERRALGEGVEIAELHAGAFAPGRLGPLFLDLHTRRIPGRLFSRERPREFVTTVVPELFRRGALRAFALSWRGEILGLQLSTQAPGSLRYWNGGFAPEAARWTPGSLLLLAQARRCCDEGLGELDLLRGDEAYKLRWATGLRQSAEVTLAGG